MREQDPGDKNEAKKEIVAPMGLYQTFNCLRMKINIEFVKKLFSNVYLFHINIIYLGYN
jgi:hypothetical protein